MLILFGIKIWCGAVLEKNLIDIIPHYDLFSSISFHVHFQCIEKQVKWLEAKIKHKSLVKGTVLLKTFKELNVKAELHCDIHQNLKELFFDYIYIYKYSIMY